MSSTVEQPVSPQVVGNAFVQQYYHILHQSPSLVHRFYQDVSRLGRPEDDGSMSITTTMKDINDKILSLNYDDFRAEIKSIDAQESFHGGVNVLVTGQMSRKDNLVRTFTQTFFLAPQEKGYFVLNDMFRYIEDVSLPAGDVEIVEDTTLTPEQDPSPVLEIDQAVAVPVEVNVEKSVEDVVVNVETAVVEEVPLAVVVEAEVVKVVPAVARVVEVVPVETRVVKSESKIEDAPKKSYASIVMVMKQSGRTVSSTPAPRRTVPRMQEQSKPVISAAEIPISGSEAAEDLNNQEGEADGYSIYIKGLPMSATPMVLEDEFKKFGIIKSGGIQVRSNKGFCFGFVEYETADSVLKALEASPIVIGGRHAVVEEKRSTNSRGAYNRGRMQGGMRGVGGPGFRNDGMRGVGGRVGNYGVNNGGMRGGGGGGYVRGGDFNNGGNREFGNNNNGNNRFGNRGGGQNRAGDGGYHQNQRGAGVNRAPPPNGNFQGGAAKEATTVPSVSASA
ncbi:nuclear transport factor 2-like [Impatiens glandulifera]|uniref:nuclear transport factor 2-like n=1 Tax=Impatiens glandulifera TaxID=253017 RepID=UPI001FB0C4BE|nr:nuclear transport factor 2-like [Impatiens glandulifera]